MIITFESKAMNRASRKTGIFSNFKQPRPSAPKS
jgi:hypothetical protein